MPTTCTRVRPCARVGLRVGARSAGRRIVETPTEDWTGSWAAAGRVPAFADLLEERSRRVPVHEKDNDLLTDDHRNLMVGNGFAAADTIWRCGPSAVLVARVAE